MLLKRYGNLILFIKNTKVFRLNEADKKEAELQFSVLISLPHSCDINGFYM